MQELNQLQCRPPRLYKEIVVNEKNETSVIVRPSFADHPLVVGPRYQQEDFRCKWSTYLGKNTSGVLVLGLNNGTKQVYAMHKRYPMRTYHLSGSLGYMTDNLFKDGKVIEKDTFTHVRRGGLEKILMMIQASNQRQMFELSGVDIQSQEAYELASSGLIRPTKSDVPVIYNIKCVEFNPPDFTIEVNSINEYEAYLMALIQNIGLRLHSLATCTKIQCIKYSYFTLDDALLKKHWTLQNIITSLGNTHRKNSANVIKDHKITTVQNDVRI
ncbi:mitochondrial mRNA pseudouridine synthase Trub2 isoform X2 [Cimex lectularius]|uniref:Pseudouridine synthase II N-terminal domain-containing protein n=1 Tax=Cimex lectularius TaxID=79782 RepID=A0A8I6R7B0_CIMLE|nr:mitochondrial mRNA pseudouridine synthase Trub2 isoform X2 [Cimex lectularius]